MRLFATSRRSFFALVLAGFSAALAMPALHAAEPAATPDATPGVVYHISDARHATVALRNIANHLAAAPKLNIVVVSHGAGIDFLLNGAKDHNGNPYEPMLDQLSLSGVSFRVCRNTLVGRKIERSQVYAEAQVVPSGVAEVARLQLEHGYAYIKP